jgi:hypothetical protein
MMNGSSQCSLDTNLDVGSRHTDTVAGDIIIRRRTNDLSSPDVELCTVQRAGHLVPGDLSFGQRGLLMRAHVIDRKEFAIDVEQSDLFALYINEASLAGCDLVRPRDFDKVSHGSGFQEHDLVHGRAVCATELPYQNSMMCRTVARQCTRSNLNDSGGDCNKSLASQFWYQSFARASGAKTAGRAISG